MTFNHLSLFSGIGGFELGMQLAGVNFQTIGYVEKDKYCQAVLQERMNDGYLNPAPIIRDITECDFRPMAGLVDYITGGFPCQPHSVAGKQQGAADTRNLWPETLGCIRDVGPRWVLLENVPGILANGYGGTVVGQLSEIGYDCIWHCVPAASVGAPHLRWRWWCLATNPRCGSVNQNEQVGKSGRCGSSLTCNNGQDRDVAYADGQGLEGRECPELPERPGKWITGTSGTSMANTERLPVRQTTWKREHEQGELTNTGWWATEPDVGRVANGVPKRVDRLKSLGNGVVPAVVARVCEELLPLINTTEEA